MNRVLGFLHLTDNEKLKTFVPLSSDWNKEKSNKANKQTDKAKQKQLERQKVIKPTKLIGNYLIWKLGLLLFLLSLLLPLLLFTLSLLWPFSAKLFFPLAVVTIIFLIGGRQGLRLESNICTFRITLDCYKFWNDQMNVCFWRAISSPICYIPLWSDNRHNILRNRPTGNILTTSLTNISNNSFARSIKIALKQFSQA